MNGMKRLAEELLKCKINTALAGLEVAPQDSFCIPLRLHGGWNSHFCLLQHFLSTSLGFNFAAVHAAQVKCREWTYQT